VMAFGRGWTEKPGAWRDKHVIEGNGRGATTSKVGHPALHGPKGRRGESAQNRAGSGRRVAGRQQKARAVFVFPIEHGRGSPPLRGILRHQRGAGSGFRPSGGLRRAHHSLGPRRPKERSGWRRGGGTRKRAGPACNWCRRGKKNCSRSLGPPVTLPQSPRAGKPTGSGWHGSPRPARGTRRRGRERTGATAPRWNFPVGGIEGRAAP